MVFVLGSFYFWRVTLRNLKSNFKISLSWAFVITLSKILSRQINRVIRYPRWILKWTSKLAASTSGGFISLITNSLLVYYTVGLSYLTCFKCQINHTQISQLITISFFSCSCSLQKILQKFKFPKAVLCRRQLFNKLSRVQLFTGPLSSAGPSHANFCYRWPRLRSSKLAVAKAKISPNYDKSPFAPARSKHSMYPIIYRIGKSVWK